MNNTYLDSLNIEARTILGYNGCEIPIFYFGPYSSLLQKQIINNLNKFFDICEEMGLTTYG
jgi:hypothetical protein